MTAPTIHSAQPILPKNVSVSLRKMDESTALRARTEYRVFSSSMRGTHQTTTERAPRGVTRMASVKAYATKLRISPTIMRVMPVHHMGDLR